MNGLSQTEPDPSEFVEVDPTGRYGRYNEILGKGASKTVYRAFDEYKGIEVAWNQVKLYDFLQSPEDLERLYCEIHLLKTLKHKNIMKFYTSWVDTANRNINFVTEMFTSGTLRQYRLKHRRVNIRAVKHWCRQILKGLLYLHNHDPPVIHRDLKCDNIFVNGNQGEVKIGDLGLAAILRKSHADHCVGTPEFMAPEIYEEAYNELVDIYSFGMCVLEMVTFEYPYSECTHPAQIYKKVISGKKPDALYKVKDPEVRQFVEKCLATVSLRLSARELLDDPFLRINERESDLRSLDYGREVDEMGPMLREPYLPCSDGSYSNGYCNGYGYTPANQWGYHPAELESSGMELFECHDDDHPANVDISIKGKRKEDGSIFLRLRIADKDGPIRNIYFPFDIEIDTALSVATEMVAELDLNDQDVTRIADMIDGEISSLVPEWRPGPGIEEMPQFANQNFCENCASNRTSTGSFVEFLSHHPEFTNTQMQCCRNGCTSMHGRFEEITYQAGGPEHHTREVAPNVWSTSEGSDYQDIWDQRESRELSSAGPSEPSHTDEESERLDVSVSKETRSEMKSEDKVPFSARESILKGIGSCSLSAYPSFCRDLSDDYENVVQRELRWQKAKYQMQLRGLEDLQLGQTLKVPAHSNREVKTNNVVSPTLVQLLSTQLQDGVQLPAYNEHSTSNGPNCRYDVSPNLETRRAQNCEADDDSSREVKTATAESCYTMSLLPHTLHRTTSLPVDAIHI